MSVEKTATEATSTSRRQEIVQASAELFATRGYDRTSLSDIAVAIGAAKSSIYHYFTSKDLLLAAVLQDGVASLLADGLKVVAEGDAPDATLRELLHRHGTNFEHKLAHLTVYLRESVHLQDNDELVEGYLDQRRVYDRLYLDVIRRGQTSGVFIEGDPQLMAYAMLGTFNWMVQWYRVDGRASVNEITEQFTSMAMRSVLAKSATKKPRGTTATPRGRKT